MSLTSDRSVRLPGVLSEVTTELLIASKHFPPFRSAHEGYGVLLEEVDELWDAIKANDGLYAERKEAIQVAAMAIRYILDWTGDPK